MPDKAKATDPHPGDRYFWFANSRRLLVVEVVAVAAAVTLRWWHYRGLACHGDPLQGEVVWTSAEWRAAHLMEFKAPIPETDVCPEEELCRTCGGTYFEVERDLEIMPCVWCDGTGKQARRELPKAPTRRSQLHPEVA